MALTIPDSWQAVLNDETSQPYFHKLEQFLGEERANHTIYPSEQDLFTALRLTPYDKVSVLILGQDPYHGPGQAHGLAFSVRPGVSLPPSLVNIYKELKSDLDVSPPKSGDLSHWAEQGVLLLNAVLTVRANEPNSHKGKGWEKFTDAVIRKVNDKSDPMIFVLWGGYAQKKASLIDTSRHTVLQSAHPSPLSARSGFFGSKPFSKINTLLAENGRPPIDWGAPAP